MSNTVIEVDNISKVYKLGTVHSGTLRDDIALWWAKKRGKEEEFYKIGEKKSTEDDYMWALKNVSFSVNQGEVLGIVGKNGAGKSTLLKILSRVTAPTHGNIKIKGRIASLLEVGTGFHPELTGRENIFLNGAILGMKKQEIAKKFDEIVAFSGVEKYIDTPVKRYSSGMYVRLAFAVAAHLESEILILDEVLAVGDAEFQKKCLGKMGDVSKKEGRTVLFVSHNMTAVKNLCTRGILLKNGALDFNGSIQTLVDKYYYGDAIFSNTGIIGKEQRTFTTGEAEFKEAYICNTDNKKVEDLYFKQAFKLKVTFEVFEIIENTSIYVSIINSDGEEIALALESDKQYIQRTFEVGIHNLEIDYDIVLMPRSYSINLNIFYHKSGATIDFVERVYKFNVLSTTQTEQGDYPWETIHGYVEPKTKWIYSKNI